MPESTPEGQPDKTPEEQRQEDDSALTGSIIARQNAQVLFYRRLGIAAIAVAAALLAVSVIALIVSFQAKGDLAASRSENRHTLAIAQQATDPKRVQAQVNVFFGVEAQIFRDDCDAKAHQFAHQDALAGRATDLAGYQAYCAEIRAPGS